MKVWVVRQGQNGEFESDALETGWLSVGWLETSDLSSVETREILLEKMLETSPDEKRRRVANHASQLWAFISGIAIGDWVLMPSKRTNGIHFGKCVSTYTFKPEMRGGPHCRQVEWFRNDVSRTSFPQDLLYSLGAFLTVFEVKRNDAANRIARIANSDIGVSSLEIQDSGTLLSEDLLDLSQLASDQIRTQIDRLFKGHDFTSLIREILEAQGFTVWQSPEGSDGGADLIANDGPLGIGGRSICIEVKSGSDSIDRPTVDKLLGAMQKFNCDYALFVAWSGYKQRVEKDLAQSLSRLRLWGPNEILKQLFEHYPELSAETRTKLPLKQIWILSDDDT